MDAGFIYRKEHEILFMDNQINEFIFYGIIEVYLKF